MQNKIVQLLSMNIYRCLVSWKGVYNVRWEKVNWQIEKYLPQKLRLIYILQRKVWKYTA